MQESSTCSKCGSKFRPPRAAPHATLCRTCYEQRKRELDQLSQRARGRWLDILPALGVDSTALVNRHGPCPGCGGRDRFRFDNKDSRGTFVCSRGGDTLAGDGFALLSHVHGWTSGESFMAVARHLGIIDGDAPAPQPSRTIPQDDSPHRQAKAAQRALAIWQSSRPAPGGHLYLRKKGIRPHWSRIDNHGSLLIPATDGERLTSLQFIRPDGIKRFLPGGRIRGSWCEITGTRPAPLLICEGFATGASLVEHTGATCFVAFASGNLLPVAQAIRAKHPRADIIIAGDNDQFTPGNPGKTAARAAALAIGGKLLIPDFTGMDLSGHPTDWNDYYRLIETATKQGSAAA